VSKHGSPERDFQVTLCKWLRLVLPRGSIVAAVTNEHATRSAPGSPGAIRFYEMRKAQGVKAGFADLIILLPGGRVFLLEVKEPGGGSLSADQQLFREDVAAIDHHYGVCDSLETARWALWSAGVPVRDSNREPAWPWKERLSAPKTRLPADSVPF